MTEHTGPARTTERAHSFSGAAAQYAAGRPPYPAQLFDAVEEFAGRPLKGARVVDVGAGTGIATALLRARGAEVVGVEPGAGMAAEFRRRLPGVPLVRGDGNCLPFSRSCADLVTFAQSWHWTDPARSVPQALRVLRPGGTLALWWNVADPAVAWIAAQVARIKAHFGQRTGAHGTADRALEATRGTGFTHHRIPWTRRVPLDTHLANLGSHSLFLITEEPRRLAFLAAERAELVREFPDGVVEETYFVDLLVTRRLVRG